MIKLGTRFYDERNDRYVTPDGVGTDPKVYRCIVEELNDTGDDYEITDTALFTSTELKHFKEV